MQNLGEQCSQEALLQSSSARIRNGNKCIQQKSRLESVILSFLRHFLKHTHRIFLKSISNILRKQIYLGLISQLAPFVSTSVIPEAVGEMEWAGRRERPGERGGE